LQCLPEHFKRHHNNLLLDNNNNKVHRRRTEVIKLARAFLIECFICVVISTASSQLQGYILSSRSVHMTPHQTVLSSTMEICSSLSLQGCLRYIHLVASLSPIALLPNGPISSRPNRRGLLADYRGKNACWWASYRVEKNKAFTIANLLPGLQGEEEKEEAEVAREEGCDCNFAAAATAALLYEVYDVSAPASIDWMGKVGLDLSAASSARDSHH
jgi:hypothetical protein